MNLGISDALGLTSGGGIFGNRGAAAPKAPAAPKAKAPQAPPAAPKAPAPGMPLPKSAPVTRAPYVAGDLGPTSITIVNDALARAVARPVAAANQRPTAEAKARGVPPTLTSQEVAAIQRDVDSRLRRAIGRDCVETDMAIRYAAAKLTDFTRAGSSTTSVQLVAKARAMATPAPKAGTSSVGSMLTVHAAGWLGSETEGCSDQQKPVVPTSAVGAITLVGLPLGPGTGSIVAVEGQFPPATFPAGRDTWRPYVTQDTELWSFSVESPVLSLISGTTPEPTDRRSLYATHSALAPAQQDYYARTSLPAVATFLRIAMTANVPAEENQRAKTMAAIFAEAGTMTSGPQHAGMDAVADVRALQALDVMSEVSDRCGMVQFDLKPAVQSSPDDLGLRIETVAVVDSQYAAAKSAVVQPGSRLVMQTGTLASTDCVEMKIVRQFNRGLSLAVSDCLTNLSREHVLLEVASCNGGVRNCFKQWAPVFGTQFEPLLIGISIAQEGLSHPVSRELKLFRGDAASFNHTYSQSGAEAARAAFGAHPFPEARQVWLSLRNDEAHLLLASFSLGLSTMAAVDRDASGHAVCRSHAQQERCQVPGAECARPLENRAEEC